jgi:hypothetical protein
MLAQYTFKYCNESLYHYYTLTAGACTLPTPGNPRSIRGGYSTPALRRQEARVSDLCFRQGM